MNHELLAAMSDMLDGKLKPINNRLDKMEGRLDKLESNVKSLQVGQLELRKGINELSVKMDETYDVVVENWGDMVESKLRLNELEKKRAKKFSIVTKDK